MAGSKLLLLYFWEGEAALIDENFGGIGSGDSFLLFSWWEEGTDTSGEVVEDASIRVVLHGQRIEPGSLNIIKEVVASELLWDTSVSVAAHGEVATDASLRLLQFSNLYINSSLSIGKIETMPFLIRYSSDASPGSVFSVLSLRPKPSEVEYPQFREYNTRMTQDHAVIIQRPLKDSRPRKWTWKNYRPRISIYETQWNILESLEARARALDGKNPIIQIWENVTDEGGFGETTDSMEPDFLGFSNMKWTQVKLVQVHRGTRKGGGEVVYEDSTVEFIIADPTWERF